MCGGEVYFEDVGVWGKGGGVGIRCSCGGDGNDGNDGGEIVVCDGGVRFLEW